MSDFTLDKEKHINHIIKEFDFNKVHNIMKYLNWAWGKYDSTNIRIEYYIPTIDDLIDNSIKLLNDVYDIDIDDYGYIESGGLKASKYEDFLGLEFVLTDYSSEEINFVPEYDILKKANIRKKKLEKINKYENN